MSRIILCGLVAIIATQSLQAQDVNPREKNATLKIVQTSLNGDFSFLQGHSAQIKLVDPHCRGDFTDLILSYEKDGTIISKVLEIDEDNVFTDGDCGCSSYCATSPDQAGDDITVDLVIHDCYLHMSKPWKALVGKRVSRKAHNSSTMRMTGTENRSKS